MAEVSKGTRRRGSGDDHVPPQCVFQECHNNQESPQSRQPWPYPVHVRVDGVLDF